MKKIILTVAAVFALTFANAQDIKSSKGENYLPVAGDWAISFNADGVFDYVGNAFNGNLDNSAPKVASVRDNCFVGKKFITDKTAYRVVANLGFGSNNLKNGVVIPADVDPSTGEVVPGTGNSFATYKASTINLTVGLGKEWRKGSTRLQGFYGADALIGFSSTKWTETNATVNQKFDAGTSFNIGLTGFIGAEYFLFPKMSIGAQYNYGLQIASQGASKLDSVELSKSTSNLNLGNVTSASMNLTLHF